VTSLEMLVGAVALLVLVLLIARPMVGIVAFAFAYPLYLVGPRLPVPGMNIETTLVGVAMALTLLRFGLRIPPPRYSLPVICLMLVLLASWLIGGTSLPRFAPDVGLWDLFRAVKSLLFTSLLFFVGYWWFQDRTDRTRLLEAISFGTGIFALTGIADFAIGFSQSARFASRAASFFQNPNMLADFLAAFSLVALYLIRQPEVTRTRRGLHLCVWGASMVAIVLTLSRSGWLGVLAGHGVWFLYVNRQLFAVGFVTVVLAATIAFPLLPAIVQERVERTTSGGVLITSMSELGALEGSAAFRILMYRIGLEMLWDSPLWGHGLHSVSVLSPHYGAKYGIRKRKAPHSLPLKLAAEAGLLGIGVYAWICLTTLMLGRALWRERDHDYTLGALLLASGATILTTNLFQTTFLTSHAESAYFWLLFGACARRYMVGDVDDDEFEELAEHPLPVANRLSHAGI
jgi:O-antigen ligase